MKESFEGFDFELQPVVIVRLSAPDQGESGRIGPNPDASAYLPPRADRFCHWMEPAQNQATG
jgi:hypothetical protein